ncbi:LLM class flavin-dependent oxidoreductase [Novosphingobium sp. ST904]|uniref:LLM class flavin-dependent oxidoreductase n=1 Tax=Novosphingobium sp. ST904 TaxID=1684385 RepID=UPI0006C8404A|nr:LLM class flavin-dependent oxidoreductase [Novosphingobium sp. ST904]KPH62106.1 luciferase [Novosphingobium sp. ST904]TCM33186.1 putative LLM family oxidoreductase [Novosphingobium sp. ST904]
MEIGLYTFADIGIGGKGVSAAQRIPEIIEEAALADEVGLHVFGLGEHHRDGFGTPAPAVVLAAIAARTHRIRLTSAVTVLSSDDPVRVFEQFAALDLVSQGRAEIMAGRGALLDSFHLFGHDLTEYEALFEEKLDLLLRLRGNDPVTWSGRFRPPLHDALIVPRPVQNPLPIWRAVGGSPDSAVGAAKAGVPMALAMLGGRVSQFAPLFDLYRRALSHYGGQPKPTAITMHGFVARTRQQAADTYFPADAALFNWIGAERGMPPMTRADFDEKIHPDGAYLVGSPEEVAEKIIRMRNLFGHQRTLVQMAVGTMSHRDLMQAIELLGTRVLPLVRQEIPETATIGA